jgi:hypothetical protein
VEADQLGAVAQRQHRHAALQHGEARTLPEITADQRRGAGRRLMV